MPAPSVTPESVVTAARGLVEQYRQALEVRSFEALAPLYDHSLDVAVIQQGRGVFGWSAVEERLRSVLDGAAEIRVQIEDITPVALGPEGATVTAAMWRSISDGVTTVEERGMLTLALRREGERWVIVTEHFSYPAGVSP